MNKPRKSKEPVVTPAERDALRAILHDSLLGSAHGIIQNNVREGLQALLTLLARPDLATLVADGTA